MLIFTFALFLLFPQNIQSYSKQDLKDATTTRSFSVIVTYGDLHCYFIPTHEGVELRINYKVVRGGDRSAAFIIRNPNNEVVHSAFTSEEQTFSMESAINGYYSICIVNQESLSPKVVAIFYETLLNTTDVDADPEDEEKVEGQDITLGAMDFQFRKIQANLKISEFYQHWEKTNWATNFSYQLNIRYNVVFWSAIQCGIILGTGIANVYLIRKLFEFPRR